MGNAHCFDVKLATQIGLYEALILQQFYYWHEGNRINGAMHIQGRIWTYQSVANMNKIFPYLTPAMIKGAIIRLINNGYVNEGNYNKTALDKTKWYSLTDKGLSLYEAVERLEKTANELQSQTSLFGGITPNAPPTIKKEVVTVSAFWSEFVDWQKYNTPDVYKMKQPLTEEQVKALFEKYGESNVRQTLLNMENYGVKKYKSAYLTANNWLNRDGSKQGNLKASNGVNYRGDTITDHNIEAMNEALQKWGYDKKINNNDVEFSNFDDL